MLIWAVPKLADQLFGKWEELSIRAMDDKDKEERKN